jgi:DNA gyrase inhibitor GyrI
MEVRIERLEPMHVAYAKARGLTPEAEAWETLLAWAEEQGLLAAGEGLRYFGHDDSPDDCEGRHGYETWIRVPCAARYASRGQVQCKAFPGGLYAVARTRVADSLGAWARLHAWVGGSVYRPGNHQWLEEHLMLPTPPWPDILLDLYHPIAEQAPTDAVGASVRMWQRSKTP